MNTHSRIHHHESTTTNPPSRIHYHHHLITVRRVHAVAGECGVCCGRGPVPPPRRPPPPLCRRPPRGGRRRRLQTLCGRTHHTLALVVCMARGRACCPLEGVGRWEWNGLVKWTAGENEGKQSNSHFLTPILTFLCVVGTICTDKITSLPSLIINHDHHHTIIPIPITTPLQAITTIPSPSSHYPYHHPITTSSTHCHAHPHHITLSSPHPHHRHIILSSSPHHPPQPACGVRVCHRPRAPTLCVHGPHVGLLRHQTLPCWERTTQRKGVQDSAGGKMGGLMAGFGIVSPLCTHTHTNTYTLRSSPLFSLFLLYWCFCFDVKE